MKYNIDELITGLILEEPIYTDDSILILKKGTQLNEKMIQRLKILKNQGKFGKFDKVDIVSSQIENMIDIEEEDEAKRETVSFKLRYNTEESLKAFLQNPSIENIQNIKRNSKEIVKAIESENQFKYDLESYMKEKDIHAHSVRVACFSVALAKIYNANLRKMYPNIEEDDLINLEHIAIAALLHDIGVICKDDKKLSKIKRIPNADMLEKHFPGIYDTPLDTYDKRYSAVYSYCLVGDINEISYQSKFMILLSNEPESEKGCLKVPFQYNTQRKSYIYGAKIIRICNLYDRTVKNTIDQNNSLEEIATLLAYYAKNGLINSEIEQLLINNLPLYPVGTKLILSSGEYATVIQSFVGTYDSYKPKVRTIPFPGRMIDLRDTTNITVKSISSKEILVKDLMKKQIKGMEENARRHEHGHYDR